MDKIIIIVGPTAVGKTKLSIDLAKHFQTEVISGDALQVYKELDIGTGKIRQAEMENIPHHMLDILNPDDNFSVADFQKLVQTHIKQINEHDKIPILVGGSGLYIQAVLYDYHFAEQKRDPAITASLEARLAKEGNMALYNELVKVDEQQAAKIHPNNYRRVIRALEVYEMTKETLTDRHKKQNDQPKYEHIIIGLEMERESLYNQINKRVDQMIADGLVKEVRQLYNQDLEDAQAMKAIGYKEIIPYLQGKMDLDTAIELLKRNSRRYAKRQLTWFKNKMNVDWYTLTPDNYAAKLTDIIALIEKKW